MNYSRVVLDRFTLQDAQRVYDLARLATTSLATNTPRHSTTTTTTAGATAPKVNYKDKDVLQQLSHKTHHALRVIEQCILDYGGLAHVALSFNGGKDCTVLLHLLASVVYMRHYLPHSMILLSPPQSQSQSHSLSHAPNQSHSQPTSSLTIPTLYVRCSNPFPQVEEFISIAKFRYNLNLVRISGDMKLALLQYIQAFSHQTPSSPPSHLSHHYHNNNNSTPNDNSLDDDRTLKAIIIGTRRTDPHGHTLNEASHTDKDWPSLMRIHPILDWSYADVWDFLKCPLLSSSSSTLSSLSLSSASTTLTTSPTLPTSLSSSQHNNKQLGQQLNEQMSSTQNGTLEKVESINAHKNKNGDDVDGNDELGGIGWCSLYSYGYTSLGSTHNTFPNPHLTSDRQPSGYKPAWELLDHSQERAGRHR